MPQVAAKAFLSYAHADNDREQGRILHLRDLIRDEFETLTGETIEIFTDNPEIRWGQDWRARLDEALQETTFFIPVLTPTYFVRDECRREMTQFVTSASSLGLDRLLLSIRYIPVPDLRPESSDELKSIAARMQYVPWDELRLVDESAAVHRRGINSLATSLVRLTAELESSSSPPPELSSTLLSDESREETPGRSSLSTITSDQQAEPEVESDDEPGLLDIVNDAEPAMAAWHETLIAFNPAITTFSQLFEASTARMNDADARPNAFAVKLGIARELAQEADEPLQKIESLAKDYSSGLLRLDPVMRAMLQIAGTQPAERREQLISSIETMVASARTASEGLRTAADAARANAGLSRDLRPVLRRFETALRNVIDGQRVMDEWEKLAQGLGSDAAAAE